MLAKCETSHCCWIFDYSGFELGAVDETNKFVAPNLNCRPDTLSAEIENVNVAWRS